jgi:hypothetical protein
MEKQSTSFRGSTLAALARDGDGNPIPLPEAASGWRIRRHTGGRPRLHLDSRKQPMIFPVTYTVADAEDILPPGNYRFDLVDGSGEPLDVIVPLTIGLPRNADAVERDPDTGTTSGIPSGLIGDVRAVLDANIRAMQMAFLHNQRMMEIGLNFTEVLKDSVRVLATSQADWIKAAVSNHEMFSAHSRTEPLRTVCVASNVENEQHGA